MNYLALGLGILAGVIALWSLTRLALVASGHKKFVSPVFAFICQSVFVAGFGTLAVWLFGMVAA